VAAPTPIPAAPAVTPFLGLAKTCRKLRVAFWDYLGDRIGVAGAPAVASLSDLIRSRGQPAGAG